MIVKSGLNYYFLVSDFFLCVLHGLEPSLFFFGWTSCLDLMSSHFFWDPFPLPFLFLPVSSYSFVPISSYLPDFLRCLKCATICSFVLSSNPSDILVQLLPHFSTLSLSFRSSCAVQKTIFFLGSLTSSFTSTLVATNPCEGTWSQTWSKSRKISDASSSSLRSHWSSLSVVSPSRWLEVQFCSAKGRSELELWLEGEVGLDREGEACIVESSVDILCILCINKIWSCFISSCALLIICSRFAV
ncbi:unnamed protein product [Moneuplotes crassus]|uniref:Uncharacterized protein n=1 Tax=Euplotes crassus TaxID=5936 RepID=A0AAD1XP54_EUPCR|nr:unnamed protein product [Moneuplotes crassus]